MSLITRCSQCHVPVEDDKLQSGRCEFCMKPVVEEIHGCSCDSCGIVEWSTERGVADGWLHLMANDESLALCSPTCLTAYAKLGMTADGSAAEWAGYVYYDSYEQLWSERARHCGVDEHTISYAIKALRTTGTSAMLDALEYHKKFSFEKAYSLRRRRAPEVSWSPPASREGRTPLVFVRWSSYVDPMDGDNT